MKWLANINLHNGTFVERNFAFYYFRSINLVMLSLMLAWIFSNEGGKVSGNKLILFQQSLTDHFPY